MRKAWQAANESNTFKTVGIMVTILGLVVNIIIQMTSVSAQEIKDLRTDFNVECKATNTERAANKLEIAVVKTELSTRLKAIEDTLIRIEKKIP